MKALFIGGVKSGKSLLAQHYTLALSPKPYYLATTQFVDEELKLRIQIHQHQREESFETIEEPLDLFETLKHRKKAVLIECLTMWLNNMLYHEKSEAEIFKELDLVLSLPIDIIFVLNDVGSGIIPDNALARKFVDLSGKIAQYLAKDCDEVYHVIAGLKQRLK